MDEDYTDDARDASDLYGYAAEDARWLHEGRPVDDEPTEDEDVEGALAEVRRVA